MNDKKAKLISMAHRKGQLRIVDLAQIGASRNYLSSLSKQGIFRRIARGVYVLADQISENETLQAVTAAVPHGVICLLSALQFHEITPQMPMETWIAIERNQAIPKIKDFAIRIVRLELNYFDCGIEEHQIQGAAVRVYSPAKTVVDCFKFRNKIGIDVAREALKESLAQSKATIDEIYRYAKICRMLNVMRPYLEIVR
jgi:predicted transcriptional regulator of viral defense system